MVDLNSDSSEKRSEDTSSRVEEETTNINEEKVRLDSPEEIRAKLNEASNRPQGSERDQDEFGSPTIIRNFFNTAHFAGDFNQSSEAWGKFGKNIASRIHDGFIKKIDIVFVATQAYTEAVPVLRANRILVLRGNQGRGKWAAAVRMLSEMKCKMILEVKPYAGVEEIRNLRYQKDAGYIAFGLSESEREATYDNLLRSLISILEKCDAYLVIILDTRDRYDIPTSEVIREYDFELPSAKLLEGHLKYYCDDAEQLKKALELGKAEMVQSLIRDNPTPAFLDKIALRLRNAVSKQQTLEEVLIGIGGETEAQFVKWFNKLGEPERAFVTALAVLDGCFIENVQDASYELYRGWNPEHKGPIPEPFGGSLHRLRQEVEAHIKRGGYAEYGASDKEIVCLNHPELRSTILSYVRTEKFTQRRVLYQWLRWLSSSPHSSVRVGTSVSAGLLSHTAFGETLDGLIRGWAKSPLSYEQSMAALALGIAASEKEHWQQTQKLLSEWIKTQNLWLYKTAAKAYGWIGHFYPSVAIQELVALSMIGDTRLLFDILNSMCHLFSLGNGNSDYYRIMLEAFNACTDEEALRNDALRLEFFLRMNENVSKWWEEPQKHGQDWPVLLYVADDSEKHRKIIARLLRLSLTVALCREITLGLIEGWLARIDRSRRSDLYVPSTDILFLIVRDGVKDGYSYERETMLFQLERWADPTAKNAAWKTLEYIRRELSKLEKGGITK